MSVSPYNIFTPDLYSMTRKVILGVHSIVIIVLCLILSQAYYVLVCFIC